jgi:hypothetical protein
VGRTPLRGRGEARHVVLLPSLGRPSLDVAVWHVTEIEGEDERSGARVTKRPVRQFCPSPNNESPSDSFQQMRFVGPRESPNRRLDSGPGMRWDLRHGACICAREKAMGRAIFGPDSMETVKVFLFLFLVFPNIQNN